MDAYQAITSRRSLRQFDERAVPRPLIDKLLYSACLAPAPHHTRPWRFVVLETPESRRRLGHGMGAAWRRDLEGDGVEPARIEALLARSRRQIEEAPALLLGCLVAEGLPARPAGGREWPDERRRRAEWGMALQSMGCALENIMVAAHAEGLASYWISAPLFCAEAVREALDLPAAYEAQALVAIGYPAPGVSPRPRPEPDLGALVDRR
ncbi:MAG: nitroreductase family protein [Dehalococcoidia bacterium]|nr:nitroreductase family protein [Dehalococcoidia bacterium]